MKRLAAILVLILVMSCADKPGNIVKRKSTIDNSVEIIMQPAVVFRYDDSRNDSDIKLSLYWHSNMPEKRMLLIVFVDEVHSILSKESLHFHIDGVTVSLSSIDLLVNADADYGSLNYIQATNMSSKSYVVPFELIEKIITANDVRVEIDISRADWHRVWMNGVFSDDRTGSAKPAFVRFYKRIKAQS